MIRSHPYKLARSSSSRRGGAYVAVIGICMLVATIGISAVIAAHVQLRSAAANADVEQARFAAHSGIELARLWITTDGSWRSRPNGTWAGSLFIGSGTVSVSVEDPNDASLSNWSTDPVRITATGHCGAARQVLQLTMVPDTRALSCLDVAACAGGTFTVNAGTLVTNQTVATNASFIASGTCFIDTSVEAAGSISGGRYYGSQIASASPRAMPASTVFDSYVANATTISFASTGGKIENVVLGPGHNPYGSQSNPQGVYVINCNGSTLTIKSSRIVGTLIVLNPKSDSKLQDFVNIAPAVAGMPSLLVKGSINFELKNGLLQESSGKNFNPPAVPYAGDADNDTVDSYPNGLKGLVYISGNLSNRGDGTTLHGPLVVGGTIYSDSVLSITDAPAYRAAPPPGFSIVNQMVPLPNGYTPVVQ